MSLLVFQMTELFVKGGSDARNLQAQESLAQRIVSTAQRRYASSGAQHHHVSVHFAPRADLRNLNRNETAAALADFVKARALTGRQHAVFSGIKTMSCNALPEAITYVQMLGVPELRMGHWTVPSRLGGANDGNRASSKHR